VVQLYLAVPGAVAIALISAYVGIRVERRRFGKLEATRSPARVP
jgi:hypothetical protein